MLFFLKLSSILQFGYYLPLEDSKQIVYAVWNQKFSHAHNQHPKTALQVYVSETKIKQIIYTS